MTFPPGPDLDEIAAALDALRAVQAGSDAWASSDAWAGSDAQTSSDAWAGSDAQTSSDAWAGSDAQTSSDAWAGSDAQARSDPQTSSEAQTSSLTEAQRMVQSLAALGVVRAAVERAAVRQVAALEQARRIDPDADPVRAAGHPDVGSLLAELWRTSLPAARQLCAVARATAPRYSLQGEELPPEFPEVAHALLDGNPVGADADEDLADADAADADAADADAADADAADADADGGAALAARISVEQAAAIVRELAKTGPGCSLEQRVSGERALVGHAPGFTVEQLRRLAVQVRDRLDQDGTEPREERQRRLRSLTVTTTRDGMAHINWFLDAESAGHVLPQITAYVSQDYRTPNGSPTGDPSHADSHASGVRFTDPDGSEPGTDMPESRSLAQLRSDGAVEVFRHRAGCTSGLTTPPVTMIVRVALADLRGGSGAAEIDEAPGLGLRRNRPPPRRRRQPHPDGAGS